MVVKSHKMFRGANGELHDTADDDDPDSPECQFAADMTAHYEELGKHFPVFARLKELSKLQFLGVFQEGMLAWDFTLALCFLTCSRTVL